MAKENRKTVCVKAIAVSYGVVGYLVKDISTRTFSYVVYDSMSDLLTDYPVTDHVIKIDGVIKKEELLSIVELW